MNVKYFFRKIIFGDNLSHESDSSPTNIFENDDPMQ